MVCASSELDDDIRARGVRLHTAPLTRAITPVEDLRALWNLRQFLRREQFDLVEVGTPKAALIGSIAARWAGVRTLIHILHGLAYQGRSGLAGRLVRLSTSVPGRLADVTISVSPSVREEAARDGICNTDRVQVIGHGSCNGVDLERFSPACRQQRDRVRAAHDIPADAVVLGFVGRLTRDKGMGELAQAFQALATRHPQAVLLIVGDYEHADRPPAEVVDLIRTHDQVRHVGWQRDPVPFIGAMDVVVLPSHREGLPGVLLEAGAVGLPIVTTDATGCRDVVREGDTGLCVPVGDAQALQTALERLVVDAAERERMGAAGCAWVSANFEQHAVWRQWEAFYQELASRG